MSFEELQQSYQPTFLHIVEEYFSHPLLGVFTIIVLIIVITMFYFQGFNKIEKVKRLILSILIPFVFISLYVWYVGTTMYQKEWQKESLLSYLETVPSTTEELSSFACNDNDAPYLSYYQKEDDKDLYTVYFYTKENPKQVNRHQVKIILSDEIQSEKVEYKWINEDIGNGYSKGIYNPTVYLPTSKYSSLEELSICKIEPKGKPIVQ